MRGFWLTDTQSGRLRFKWAQYPNHAIAQMNHKASLPGGCLSALIRCSLTSALQKRCLSSSHANGARGSKRPLC